MRLRHKVAIVTGGASGIGKAGCLTFAKEGAQVAVVDLRAEYGQETAEQIRQAGGEAIFLEADVSDEQAVRTVVERTLAAYGKIDILYNNATWYNVVPADRMDLADWQRTLDVTLTGPFLLSKHVIPAMIELGGGSIIHTSSVGGTVAFPEHPAYNAAKGGLNLLVKNLALDYGRYQIRVNAISPGIIETPLTQKAVNDPDQYRDYVENWCFTGRIGTPQDITNAALFLASDESAFITGSVMFVDNGWTAR
ncbi:SDR family NAD(P)-dependent oxidoreductase [Paenibacillus oceani]|uniref:Glucose 1-dehydrogenase n=1 Tax=Paenibacillus oceani TaxID=2772510 RepID=A0A927H3B9_9BACL|nr:glucose 1-dehydrogenase [Paenibacillus oceani]MBD2865324.1 glucose 1-dehydrogenase [Paenibacillus oceani]